MSCLIFQLLDKALADPELAGFFNNDVLKGYRGLGGVAFHIYNHIFSMSQVRIEDDVIIWEKGNENMSADVPRTVEQIETFMTKREDHDQILYYSIVC